jgi:hypothetical protein
MPQASDYTALIAPEHAGAPKYMAWIAFLGQCFADEQNFLLSVPAAYDLDTAVGVWLDAVGQWAGITRNVTEPIAGVYFSFGIAGVGFGQGVWKGPLDPATGVISLDDETYRLLIRAKIGANHWDGTMAGSQAILAQIFSASVSTSGTYVFIDDNQDMSITIGISGQIPSALFLALLSGGHIPIKPATVHASYEVTSVNGAPIFGFGVQNNYISGFGSGAWATSL